MMIQPIFDVHTVAARDSATEDSAQTWLAKLIGQCAELADLSAASGSELAEQMLERAETYADSQPSFAADLRAAVARVEEPALA